MSEGKKITWINTLKAIGIVLVVIGHNDTIFTEYIYSFHMPLFFLLSGITYNGEKWSGNPGAFVKRKAKGLLKPYFFYAFILYLIWIPLSLLQGKEITIEILLRNLFGIFYSQGGHKYMDWGIPIWFLTCLFLVSIIYYYINKYNRKSIIIILVITAILGKLSSYLPVRLPWSLDSALTGIVFYGIGNLFKEKIISYKPNKKTIAIAIVLIILGITFSELNGRVDVYGNNFNNIIFYYISSLSSIIVLIFIAKILPYNNIIEFLGINTLPILVFHIRAIQMIKFIDIKILKLNINYNSILFGGIIIPIIQISIIYYGIIIFRKIKTKRFFKINNTLN